jgi:fructose-1,6-bisphosphatase
LLYLVVLERAFLKITKENRKICNWVFILNLADTKEVFLLDLYPDLLLHSLRNVSKKENL